MKQLHTKKTFFLLFLLSMAAIWSCNKNVNDVVNNPQLPDLTTKVTTSVSGFVTNENDGPMSNATITIGTRTATTNQYGYFEVKNVEVVKTAAVV